MLTYTIVLCFFLLIVFPGLSMKFMFSLWARPWRSSGVRKQDKHRIFVQSYSEFTMLRRLTYHNSLALSLLLPPSLPLSSIILADMMFLRMLRRLWRSLLNYKPRTYDDDQENTLFLLHFIRQNWDAQIWSYLNERNVFSFTK